MSDLVTLEDVTVIESTAIEVGDSSCQFEMGKSFHYLDHYRSFRIKTQSNAIKNIQVLEERFENHIWGKGKRS